MTILANMTAAQQTEFRAAVDAATGRSALLKTLAASASASNPVEQPPLAPPAAWAATTAYLVGDVVRTSTGRVLVGIIAGTTGGTEPTVVTTGAGQPVDGTMYWAYAGDTSGATDAANPTVTTANTTGVSTAVAGLTNYYLPLTQSGNFTLLGAAGLTNIFGAGQPYGYPRGDGTNTVCGGSLGFETEAQRLAIIYPFNTSSFRVMIDGRWRTIQPEIITKSQGANSYNYTLLDFGSSKTRRIVIDMAPMTGNPATIYRIDVSPTDQIRPLPVAGTLGVISDSWGAGAGYAKIVGNYFPWTLARLLGFTDLVNDSIGGTGHVNKGSGSVYYNFAERVPSMWATLTGKRKPDFWVVAGSVNDNGSTQAVAIQAGVLATITALRATGSKAPIVFIGVQPIASQGVVGTGAGALAEAAIQAGIAASGDALCFFIPVIGDPNGPWISSTWNNSGRTTYDNGALMVGNDSTHSYDIGYTFYAKKAAAAIRASVYSSL